MIDIPPTWTNIFCSVGGFLFGLFGKLLYICASFTIKKTFNMENNNENLKKLTENFIQDFIKMSGEEDTYAINFILPKIMAPLLPKYPEEFSIVLPMASFDVGIMKAGIRERAKGWTKSLLKIMEKIETEKVLDFDRYKFENFTIGSVDRERCEITNYEKLDFKFVVRPHVVKTFDIISNTNNFKGTVSIVFENDPELYPVREVSLICEKKVIFHWDIYKENGEEVSDTIDPDQIKNLNAFYFYTIGLEEM